MSNAGFELGLANGSVEKAARAAAASYVATVSSSGFTDLVAAPGAGYAIVCTGLWISSSGSNNVYLASASTQKTPTLYLTAGGGLLASNLRLMPIVCAANEKLRINCSAANAVSVRVDYRIVETP